MCTYVYLKFVLQICVGLLVLFSNERINDDNNNNNSNKQRWKEKFWSEMERETEQFFLS